MTLRRSASSAKPSVNFCNLEKMCMPFCRYSGASSNTDSNFSGYSEANIAKLTTVSGDGTDSLHRLVMDLHKDLNKIVRRSG